MSYEKKYELGHLLLDGPTQTYRAREILTGRPVLVHLLVGHHNYSTLEKFLRQVRWLQEASAGNGPSSVIEVSQDAGSPYVVTEEEDSFAGLDEWVKAQAEKTSFEVAARWNQRIDESLEARDYEAAFAAVGDALGALPGNEELQRREEAIRLLCRGLELCQQGRGENGAQFLWQAYQVGQENPYVRAAVADGLLERAQELLKTDWQEADQYVQVVLRLDPDHPEATDLSKRINPKREELVSWCLYQAAECEARGDVKAALAVLEEGLTAHPEESRLVGLKEDLKAGHRRAPQSKQTAPPKPVAQQNGGKGATPAQGLGDQNFNVVLRSVLQAASESLTKKFPALAPFVGQGPNRSPLLPAALGVVVALVILLAGWWVWGSGDATVGETYPRVVRSSVPGATILIDGEVCGTSECGLDLASGTHEARAELAGYRAAVISFEVTPPAEGDATSGPDPIELLLEPLPPLLRLSSDLSSAQVVLDGKVLGQLEDGNFERELAGITPGSHTLTISEQSGSATIRFEANPGSAPLILAPVQSSSIAAVVVASLGPRAVVHSDQQTGEAKVDGELIGKLGPSGVEAPNLAAGSHELAVGNGDDVRRLIFESGMAPTLTAYLKSDRNAGALSIETGEDGASVYLNGRKYRRTTQRGRLLLYLEPDSYRIRVEKAGFRPLPEQTAEVRKGGQARLSFKLEPEPKTALLAVRGGVPGTEVLIDGESAGVVGPDGTLSAGNVSPGSRTISLRKKQFRPRQEQQNFTAGETVEIDGSLVSTLGGLKLAVNPPSAHLTWRREGENIDHVVTGTTLTLEEGTYTIKAGAKGYQNFATTLRVVAGETRTAEVALERVAIEKREPVLTADGWLRAGGWYKEGNLIAKRGGKITLAPGPTGAGLYEFEAQLRDGRRLEWVLNYVDDNNYTLFEINQEFLYRTEIRDGKKSKTVRSRHPLGQFDNFHVRIEVTKDSITHRGLHSGEWMIIDRWTDSGNNFGRGKFGFHLPGNAEMALRSFSYRPDF